tara:strand:+ start:482 stop:841 length:360 start_codon:yes stop_codon:yes gene_type:complete
MDKSEFEEETKNLKSGRVYIVLQDSETKEDFEEHGFFKVMIFDTTDSEESADADIKNKSTSFVVANGLFSILANSPMHVFDEGVDMILKNYYDDLREHSSEDNLINFMEYKKNPHGRPN